MSINRVVLTGNLTREPELKRTASGVAILNFGIAVNDRRKDPQSGEWGDYPNFIDCTMFGTRAEAVSDYLHKGSKIGLEGKLHYSSWNDKQGNKRSKLDVTIDEIELLTPKDSKPRNTTPDTQYPEASVYDDDCPF